MKPFAVLAVAAAALSCVPASEPRPPAGAAGFDVEPSPAARGEPFDSDGWTLTIEKLVIRAYVSVRQADSSAVYGSSEGASLLDARKTAQIYATAIPVGPAQIGATMSGRYISRDNEEFQSDVGDIDVNGIDPGDVKRFEYVSDEGFKQTEYGYNPGRGPSVLLVMRARRGEREVSLDLALNSDSFGAFEASVPIEIRADALALAILDVVPEAVFRDDFGFGKLANHDADGDGRITADELRAAEDPRRGVGPGMKSSYLDAFATRIGAVLLHPRPR